MSDRWESELLLNGITLLSTQARHSGPYPSAGEEGWQFVTPALSFHYLSSRPIGVA